MADLDTDDPGATLSKHDKLVNAWRAAGRDANVETVASLTGASQSYASQVRQAIEQGDLSDAEVAEATVPDLVDRYEKRVEEGSTETGTEDGNSNETAPRSAGNGTGASEGARDDTRGRHQPPSESPDDTQRPAGGREQSSPSQQTAPPAQQHPPQPPRPPQQPPQSQPQQQQPGQGQTNREQGRERIQAEDGLYVPVGDLGAIDETLAVLEDEARFQVENLPPNQPQYQVALAKLYVARQARSLVGDAADDAVPADEV